MQANENISYLIQEIESMTVDFLFSSVEVLR
jgi:hypothetical protein